MIVRVEIPPGPPLDQGQPPISGHDYVQRLSVAWRQLLDRAVDERALQTFLERHPALLPGAFPEHGGHGAFLQAAISKPRMNGEHVREPDFVLFARDSLALRPVLVELEAPTKRWAAGGDRPRQHSDLSQPLSQLDEWREWLAHSGNRQSFLDSMHIPDEWRRRSFEPIYVLVHGRKDEGESVSRIRARLRAGDRLVLTYDHLRPHPWMKDYITVRSRPNSGFTALHMSPTARLTPDRSEEWRLVFERSAMVRRNEWISAKRKSYLLDMIPRWDAWAAEDPRRWGRFHEEARRRQGTQLRSAR